MTVTSVEVKYAHMFQCKLGPHEDDFSDAAALLRTMPFIEDVRTLGGESHFVLPSTTRPPVKNQFMARRGECRGCWNSWAVLFSLFCSDAHGHLERVAHAARLGKEI